MCTSCNGFISFEWAVENGYVNGKMKRDEAQRRYDRWKNDKPENRPEVQIDRFGNLIGVDGLLTNGWKSSYIVRAMKNLPVKSESPGA